MVKFRPRQKTASRTVAYSRREIDVSRLTTFDPTSRGLMIILHLHRFSTTVIEIHNKIQFQASPQYKVGQQRAKSEGFLTEF